MTTADQLVPSQREFASRMIAVGEGASFRTVLLIGPRGSGKRTLAAAVASRLGLEFVEVPLSGHASSVLERLRGARSESGGAAPFAGELGRVTPTMLYLSHIDTAADSIHHVIHQALTSKRYIAGGVETRGLDENVWVVGSLTSDLEESAVNKDHWLCTAFGVRLTVDCPSSAEELSAICNEIAGGMGLKRELSQASRELVAAVPLPADNLHAVRRWIENASIGAGGSADDEARVQESMTADVRWLLGRIQYRGKFLTTARFDKWAKQFPKDLKGLPVHLVREIAERYHISQAQYHEAISALVTASGLRAKARISFCSWQRMGKSGPRVANDFKNQSRWTILSDLDLDAPTSQWPDLERLGCSHIVIVDDFVGSGQTILKLVEGSECPMSRINQRYPNLPIVALAIAGFESAIADFRAKAPGIQFLLWRVFDERDRCFVPQSRIFTDQGTRVRFESFCIETAVEYYPGMPDRHRLGFNGVSCLATFSASVPNNTLPIIWHDQGKWFPLLPGAGVL